MGEPSDEAGRSGERVTRLLVEAGRGDRRAADELLPLVYQELRELAGRRMARESPGQTLQATALVHEAYLRLVDGSQVTTWDGRGHFYAAAAEAMRRILVERARRKAGPKAGGHLRRMDLEHLSAGGASDPTDEQRTAELLALDEALADLDRHDGQAARLVNLRYFGGLSHQEAAHALGLGRRQADRIWALARAWLFRRLGGSP